MITIADEIATLPSGARFFRADLHIHSFDASHDVKDPTMTPEAIIDTAVSERLAIIAITDHNEISNVGVALKAAQGKSLLVVPGVELSTPEGHLLTYFRDLVDLESFYGKLDIAGRGTHESRCQTSLLECLKKIDPAKGFAILAHVDAEAGLEKRIPGNPPHKSDILCSAALLGLELKSAQSTISFSDIDDDPERKQIGRKRIEALSLGSKQFLARVLFSDSHSLAALGKNAQGQRRMTRIKMDSPSYEGLKIALQDADARIRLEDEVPQSVAYVMGMKMEGGFLDGSIVHFSRNLNCIIGGRGAGKSTAFEAVRCLAPTDSKSKLLDCEIWPARLSLVWVDEVGQQALIQRSIEEECENLTDPEGGLTVFPIESYGQNETAQTSVKAQSDPAALLNYLDQFVNLAPLKRDEEQVRNELLSNQTDVEKAQIQVTRIPETKKYLAVVQQQLRTLESANAHEVVSLERKVAEERALRENIDSRVASLTDHLKKASLTSLLTSVATAAKPEDLKVGASELKEIVQLAGGLQQSAMMAESSLSQQTQAFQAKVKSLLAQWKAHEQAILAQIEAKRRELAAKGISLDLPYIKKLAADEANYLQVLKVLSQWEIQLKELQKVRQALLSKRQAVRAEIYKRRYAYTVKANQALKKSLSDLSVTIKFSENASSYEGEQIIQQAMSWRTSQVPRAGLLVQQVTIPKLLDAVKRSDPTLIAQVVDKDGSKVFNKSEASDLISALKSPSIFFQLERCNIEDLPTIKVTRVVDTGDKPQVISRDFAKLSLGQQQSILLALMLSSDSQAPLIIDQPEDNLDSEFIFHSLVPVLRAAKERRQIIVVTHNPNIAVLGDAEQIIALKSASDKSMIVARGSIDEPKTREMVCRILEGAKEAFKKRAKMYGVI